MDNLTQHNFAFVLPDPESVKSGQKWTITLGPKNDLHTETGEVVVVKGSQIGIYPGLQPQWVILNFIEDVAQLKTGDYKIVRSGDDFMGRPGRVVVGGLFEGGINNYWVGGLTVSKDDSGKFTILFNCDSEYTGWTIKHCEISFSL